MEVLNLFDPQNMFNNKGIAYEPKLDYNQKSQ